MFTSLSRSKMTFKIDQLVQVFLDDHTCRESKILWEEDNGNYRVCWLEDTETISIIRYLVIT